MPLKIYRREGDIWHFAGTVAGHRVRGSTGTADKATAQRIASEREAREWKGRLDGPAAVLTFAQAATIYTAAGKPARYVVEVLDYWKDTPIKAIRASAIRESCAKLYPNVKASTWNRSVIVPTQAIINFAAEKELCPPIRVKRFKVVKTEKIPAQLAWVTAFQSQASPHLGALAIFMFMTGARISEALALEWSDINFGARTARVKMGKLGGDERVANLPPPVIVALANIERKRDAVFFFGSRHNLKTQWELAIVKAGIKRLTPHSCRHGFATSMLHAGVDPVTVAKAGGWKDTAMLWKTYGHARDDVRVTDILATPAPRDDAEKLKVVEKLKA